MPLTIDDLYRTPVYSRRGKRIGKVVDVLFDAEKPVVVGVVVQRPRFLYILDVRDRFLAFDSVKASRDAIDVTGDKDAWDKQAAKRLGLDWESTVVWSRMPVRAEDGTALGEVGNVEFDPTSGGKVLSVKLSGGATADLAVGTRTVAGELVRGYRDGAIVVDAAAVCTELSGGAAGAAGKASVVAKKQLGEASVAAGKAAKEALTAGKAAAKAAAQTKTGKKAVGWLKSMRDEMVDAMRAPDDDDD